jgi:hypothetical protein
MVKRGERGQVDGAVNTVVSMFVGAIVAAHLVPMAINEIGSVSTAGWSSSTAQWWEIMPVMIAAAVLIHFAGSAVNGGGR